MTQFSNNQPASDIVAEARRERLARETTYREKALKLFPHLCARCGREFAGKRLKELTVHHKDHNHDNNPADGRNWELLCLYCHENEHAREAVADWYDTPAPQTTRQQDTLGHQPFAGLEKLLQKKVKG